MYARDIFTGISGWTANNYSAPTGMFGGSPNFQASALFMPTYGGPPPSVGSFQQVWGNLDAAAFKGWSIGINAAGLIIAQYGTGAALVSVTFDPRGRLLRRWCLATLAVGNGGADIALWVNGNLEAANTGGAALVANTAAAVVGGSTVALDDPFTGLVAGVSYAQGLGVDPYALATDVARTGQLSLLDTSSALPTLPDNCWQVPFFNVDAGPTWEPALGTTALTRNGQGNSLVTQNAPSNAWL